jgi:hypothetical protein
VATDDFAVAKVPVAVDPIVDGDAVVFSGDAVVDVDAADAVDVDRAVDSAAEGGCVLDEIVEVGNKRVAVGVDNVGVPIAVGVGDNDDDDAAGGAADVVGGDI